MPTLSKGHTESMTLPPRFYLRLLPGHARDKFVCFATLLSSILDSGTRCFANIENTQQILYKPDKEDQIKIISMVCYMNRGQLNQIWAIGADNYSHLYETMWCNKWFMRQRQRWFN